MRETADREWCNPGKCREPLIQVRPRQMLAAADRLANPLPDDGRHVVRRDAPRGGRPQDLEITVTRFGGHCGFYDGRSGATWVEREVVRSFAESD